MKLQAVMPGTLLNGDFSTGFFLRCEYCEVFKNTYFEEHLQTAAPLKKPEMFSKCHNNVYEFRKRVQRRIQNPV